MQYEPVIRLTAFAVVLGSLVLLEHLVPRRKLALSRRTRWPSNFGVLVLNTAILRIFVPLGAVGIALWAEKNSWGLLNQMAWPPALKVALAVLLLDLAIYGQHVLFHFWPPLWRLHRVHHTDPDVDVSTGNRFHLLEILLSMALKAVLVVALGFPALGVLIFEIVLNAGSMFTHSNIRLPGALDRAVRLIFVTPDMHRIHHSVDRPETDSNFGFNLSCWDRLFATYRAQPRNPHETMELGQRVFRQPSDQRLDKLLGQPFFKRQNKY